MRFGNAKEVVSEYLGFLEFEEAERMRREQEKADAAGVVPVPVTAAKSERRKPSEDPYGGLYGPIFAEFDHIADLEVALKRDGAEADHIALHSPLTIEYSFTLQHHVEDLNITLKFFRKDGLNLTTISTLNGDTVRQIHEGRVRCRCSIADFDFNPGVYALVLAVHEGRAYLYRDVVKFFAVIGDGRLNWGLRDVRYTYEVERVTPLETP